MHVRLLPVLLAFSLLLPACPTDDPVHDALTTGLEPLEPNTATLPPPAGSDAYPETAVVVSGMATQWFWAHLKGYVHAPLATVWEAMRDPEVCLDRRSADSWTIARDTEPEYPFSFRQHIVFTDVITVDWDVSWRMGPLEGPEGAPTTVGGRWQKTAGTAFVTLLVGSVLARAVTDDTTEVQFIEHLKSFNRPERAIQTVRDYYDSIVARAHGRPLPRFR
jgi:hypothetical protein